MTKVPNSRSSEIQQLQTELDRLRENLDVCETAHHQMMERGLLIYIYR